MEPQNIKVVAFDCDGVLFDTTNANKLYYNRILSCCGLPEMTPSQFAFAHMSTVEETLKHLFPNEELMREATMHRKAIGYEPFFKEMVIEPRLRGLLARLSPEYKIAIATNRSDTMGGVLAEFDLTDKFDLVVTALDVHKPKPNPEPLLKVLNHFNARPDQAIYVGDSSVDEMAAKAADIPFIAYQNKALSADFHIESLDEIGGILNIQ